MSFSLYLVSSLWAVLPFPRYHPTWFSTSSTLIEYLIARLLSLCCLWYVSRCLSCRGYHRTILSPTFSYWRSSLSCHVVVHAQRFSPSSSSVPRSWSSRCLPVLHFLFFNLGSYRSVSLLAYLFPLHAGNLTALLAATSVLELDLFNYHMGSSPRHPLFDVSYSSSSLSSTCPSSWLSMPLSTCNR